VSLEAWTSLVAAYQAVLHDVVGALEQDAGLDSGVYSALAYLERAEPPGRMRMADLQRLMYPRYSQPGLSRLVARMEDDGLVARRSDPDDGRAAIVSSTAAGRTRYRRANKVYTAAVDEHFARYLGKAESRQLMTLLDTIRARRDAAAPS
jgi:DNA-binding MarR family transcriptional regulator